jgi:hypothetical protein
MLMAKTGASGTDSEALIARLEQELRDMRARSEAAEARLVDQSSRLMALGSGREETMRLLAETRMELARVIAERDQLRKQFVAIEGMQTETVAFTEKEQQEATEATGAGETLPSIDELMANLNDMMEQDPRQGVRLSGQSTEAPEAAYQEMIAPELIVPEEFGGKDESKPRSERRREDRRRESMAQSSQIPPNPQGSQGPVAPTTHLLVYLDAAHPIKYPLFKDVMTIGRSENADIRIEGHFISRVHARILRAANKVTVEDVGSKNGVSVNAEAVTRQELKHGDVIGIGRLRFAFIEAGANG